ncbi:hypothetical protein PF006_g10903 [Phytophthora fragariae]|uniref:Uncharacterized protein n=1 Tax=Phytophthora fragariae TaxID=53985 RepID=A0A6A3TZJ8_9STRA|nr:hypothetical protein PF006_g10903 [Phytophthora fragariae]
MRPVDEKIFNDNNIVHLPYSDLYIISHADAIEIVISGLTTGALAAQALSALVAGTREVKEKNIHYKTLGDINVDGLPSEYTTSKLVSSSLLSSEESVTLELSSKLAMASMSCSVFTSFGRRFLRLASGFLALDLGLGLGVLSWLDGGAQDPEPPATTTSRAAATTIYLDCEINRVLIKFLSAPSKRLRLTWAEKVVIKRYQEGGTEFVL